ncbi:hypothetical protein F0U44_07825 [Nocardioides humilatus]|uniref:Thrombospondin type 3 repeat-containing protein n=1 Tax=Nocardioides humilatus TaxID=2607660 RepID=A0A5B1LI26_9ACTN|nr:hypothetical protein [Nocardioides humilatus]KAA1420313.1 hypothetical protein F0U44_07825 [Nocardioides humilatus]
MKARMGIVRGLSLGAAAAMVAAGLGVVETPAAHAVDPAFPAPDSASWIQVKKGGAAVTDEEGELDDTLSRLDMTSAGGASGPGATVSADLHHAYFRFHLASLPADAATGGYVVQFDTNNDLKGWERALRYDPSAGVVTVFNGDDSAVNAQSDVVSTIAIAVNSHTSYADPAGGAFLAFAITRAALTNAGINLGAPMVFGATSETVADIGAGLNGKGALLSKPKADILGVGKSNPNWSSVASDPLAIDSDGDGIADNLDNCPVVLNADQADDDAAVDNSLPSGTVGQPDGTEGHGNVCDATPRGYDLDGDDVGLMDDQCPEQYGALANGCVAQSTTTAILRYKAATKTFSGLIGADYDQCLPKRRVAVYRLVKGPDTQLGVVKTDDLGKFKLVVTKRQPAGKYYASVDPKWTLGARCFGVKSPKIQVG